MTKLIKKITTGIVSLGLVGSLIATSAMAVDKEVYNENYKYRGNSKNLTWTYTGDSYSAATTGSNSSGNKYTRYIYVYVARRNAKTGALIKSSTNNVTTKNAGVSCTVSRDKTNKNIYFQHYSKIKTDSKNLEVIYQSPTYNVYQKGN